MKINTKFFGEVEIADDKIITFDKGIIGFPELKHFTMLHDEEKGSNVGIRYLQSLEEFDFLAAFLKRYDRFFGIRSSSNCSSHSLDFALNVHDLYFSDFDIEDFFER